MTRRDKNTETSLISRIDPDGPHVGPINLAIRGIAYMRIHNKAGSTHQIFISVWIETITNIEAGEAYTITLP